MQKKTTISIYTEQHYVQYLKKLQKKQAIEPTFATLVKHMIGVYMRLVPECELMRAEHIRKKIENNAIELLSKLESKPIDTL